MVNLPFLQGLGKADPNGIMGNQADISQLMELLRSMGGSGQPMPQMPDTMGGPLPQMPRGIPFQPMQDTLPPPFPGGGDANMYPGPQLPNTGKFSPPLPGLNGSKAPQIDFAEKLSKALTGGLFDLNQVSSAAESGDPNAMRSVQQIDPGFIELLKRQIQQAMSMGQGGQGGGAPSGPPQGMPSGMPPMPTGR
jgi:hypothetical protein